MKKGNPKHLVTYADLKADGVKVGVPGGGSEERLSLQAGASDYIAKPVNTEQLLSLLRVWLYR